MRKQSIKRGFGVSALVLGFYLFISIASQAQSISNDLNLISALTSIEDHKDHKKKKVKLVQAINPVYWVYQGSLGFYQKHLSPQLSTACIYETSCSRFSRKLIGEYGLLKGFFLSCDRISRCNRLTHSQTSRLRYTGDGRIKEYVEQFSFRK